jgi:hypothetical protein
MLILVSVASCLVVVWVIGRYHYAGIDVDWNELATPAGQRALADLRRRFALERPVIDMAIGRPVEVAAAGDEAEGIRLLVGGYEYMAGLAQDRAQLLRSMARYSRMVTAMMPLQPLAPRAFRLRGLATVAGLAAVAHHFLVTVPERFRLRAAVLGAGLRIVLRALARAGARGGPPKWQIAVDALADWHTLDAETLESFRALMTAVSLPEQQAAKERRA